MARDWTTWLLRLLLIGVVGDLAIAGVLAYQTHQLDQIGNSSHCWDQVLAHAVAPRPPPRAVLVIEAQHCAAITP